MKINKIQNYDYNSNPQFKMKIMPSESVKYAVKTSRDLISSPYFCESHRDFVQEFCNSIARILKSNQAERIWTTVCRSFDDGVGPSYIKEYYKDGSAKEVVWLDSIQKDEHKYGNMMYSQEGGNIMRTLIDYAKTIKDVPEQDLKLKDEELKHYAFNAMQDDLINSIGGFYYV